MSVAESLIWNLYQCVEVSCLNTYRETIIHSHTHTRTCEVAINAAGMECTFLLFLFSIHFVLGVRVCTPVVNGFGYQSKTHTQHSQSTSFYKQTMLYPLPVSCSVYFSVSLTCFSHANRNAIGLCNEFAVFITALFFAQKNSWCRLCLRLNSGRESAMLSKRT